MVRIRSKPAKSPTLLSPQSMPVRKRKYDESKQDGVRVKNNKNGDNASSPRASKRVRATLIPYQSPASLDALITTAAKRNKRVVSQETPKKKAETVGKRNQKRPEKPVKRLQKKATLVKPPVKAPVRRKILATPEPTQAKKAKASVKSKVQKAKKAIAQVTKKKAVSPRKKVEKAVDTAPKKRKKAQDKGKQVAENEDENAGKRPKKEAKKGRKGKGKLTPKPDLTNYEKNPNFETKLEIPFVSTLAHSRLLIRAVILNDMKLLKKMIYDEPDKIYTTCASQSFNSNKRVFDYICEFENKEAFKILHKIPEKTLEKFGSAPSVLLSRESTGHGSTMMFGHALRQVNVGRGGKEGNDAFLYDNDLYSYGKSSDGDCLNDVIEKGVSLNFIEFLMKEMDSHFDPSQIQIPLRRGRHDYCGKCIATAVERGGYGFNFLHEEALTKKTSASLTPFKPVSVVKKCTYSPRFSPLHCAAINPNTEVLIALLRSMPDYNLADGDGWTVGHYAAVCSGDGPLKYLLQFGISTQAITSAKRGGDGYSLLHVAVLAGRTHNVKVILEHEKAVKESANVPGPGEDNDDEDTGGKGKQKDLLQNDILYKLSTHGKNVLHMACELGHLEIVKLLLDAEVDVNRPTPAKYDRMTPLILAAQFGYLDIVKLLIDAGAKVEAKDKRGRTAAAYAAMHGKTHVLSYLLRLGVNHLALDSSGNSLLHYAAAYGWYFETMLLLEAGCPPNAPNNWKMTPVAIAFMKGHTGLVGILMKQEGVDVNARIDDASGRTLLLETCFRNPDLAKLKFLVETLQAEPKCEDFGENNALHYFALKTLSEHAYDFQKNLKSANECVNYLIRQGCDPFKADAKGSSSILMAACQKNFHYIQNILKLSFKLPFEKEEGQGNTLLHYLTDSFQSDIAYNVFTKLVTDTSSLTVLKEMSKTYNKQGLSPFLNLLQKHTQVSGDQRKRLLNMVETFLTKFGVDVNAMDQSKTPESALHLIVKTNFAMEVLPILMKFKPNLDPQNSEGQTPLLVAVLGGLNDIAEKLITAGANVKLKIQKENNIGLALLTSMKETKSFYLIPKLLAKGADAHEVHPKTKNSILHYIARKPMLPQALEALNSVIEVGVNPDLVNCDGRTPLHLVINARGSETDVFYDIEDALISAGANLAKKDQRGRIPLHYAFVKIGDPTNKLFFDPIELVSSIITAMNTSGAGADIHSMDVFGSTPLHYAAFRGATICSSYLIQAISRNGIDLSDNNGNTPFGLAVRNCHEGCALNFYQKDADFLRVINNNIKTVDMRTEEAQQSSTAAIPTSKEAWEWEHLVKENEEREKLFEEQQKYPILEQVVKHNWQGLLYLMIGRLETSGVGFSTGIATALKTSRLKLALKLALRVKSSKELRLQSGTLFHNLAKMYNSSQDELVIKICQSFRKNGLDPTALDEFGSQAIIYALTNQQINLTNIIFDNIRDPMASLATMKPDLFGRTPFTALFWNMKLETPLQHDVERWGTQLVAAGANPNQQCEYPIFLSSFPGIRFSQKLTDIIPSNSPKYTPLIIAVLTKSYKTVKWLLNIRSGPFTTNLNGQDSEGRTALMHAVRLNDFQMLKTLLDPGTYDYTKDPDGSKSIQIRSTVDVSVRDKQGWTVMDYLICSTGSYWQYKNIKSILQVLQKIGGAMTVTSGDGLQPIDRALKHKRQDIVEILNKFAPSKQKQIASSTAHYYPLFSSNYSQDIILTPIQDYNTSAERMAEKIMEKAKEKMKKEGQDDILKPKPDDLCGFEDDNRELIMDEKQNIPYDAIMTKVDLAYGVHGLYNFYKMQLVKEPRGKKMIILFTQWGRVGETGQYQRTPFATEDEAIKEFTKIFRAKSGNAWEDVQNFTQIPAKYRLMKKDLRTVKYSTQVKVDFEEIEKFGKNANSTLPGRILYLMRNLSLVHQDAGSTYGRSSGYISSHSTHPDYCNLPLLPMDVLEKAENILREISVLLEKDEKMKSNNKITYTEQEKMDVMNNIVTFSEEFYSLIPVYGYATEKLEPIFQYHDLRAKVEAINRLVHLELAKSMILGAQLHQANTNPFEYIYRCLGTKVHLLDRGNSTEREEIEIILQYVHNTSDNGVKVTAIYRIEKPSEDLKLDRSNVHNRQLLWHGTSSANLLSILQQGLQVAPMGSEISGHLFGKGIYLADMFAKSQHYCRTVAVHGKSRQYILLAEAALGKVYEVKLGEASDKPMPKNYDSLKTSDSRYLPDPQSTVTWKGRTVALGPQTERRFKENEYWGLDYNEYIIFNSNQVAMRYLVEFE